MSLSLLKTRLGLEPTEQFTDCSLVASSAAERERGVCVVTSGDFKGRISLSVVCDNSSL